MHATTAAQTAKYNARYRQTASQPTPDTSVIHDRLIKKNAHPPTHPHRAACAARLQPEPGTRNHRATIIGARATHTSQPRFQRG